MKILTSEQMPRTKILRGMPANLATARAARAETRRIGTLWNRVAKRPYRPDGDQQMNRRRRKVSKLIEELSPADQPHSAADEQAHRGQSQDGRTDPRHRPGRTLSASYDPEKT
jgi:hypothetical protein